MVMEALRDGAETVCEVRDAVHPRMPHLSKREAYERVRQCMGRAGRLAP
ncbi:hypothetical protein GCM10011392_16400 [Wenxinia marina]|uniref:Uncharacterized protein n=1 Tax=Wenxinia marina DSM 24838 TaxID=1123501 RepID=A0A0D0PEZ9_9RHOB|nr:hypothetical protein Wenmar_01536 [Wenxinia marina DSM 24838]GGL62493.1 hypothetical protein GCM10011392_16400 [Wenxinia marina]